MPFQARKMILAIELVAGIFLMENSPVPIQLQENTKPSG